MVDTAIELKAQQVAPHLDELCGVIALLYPDAAIGAAIYTDGGRLISTSVAGDFVEKLPKPSAAGRTGRDSAKTAQIALECGSGLRPLILALKANRSLNTEVLERLCDVGRM